jgi:integrase
MARKRRGQFPKPRQENGSWKITYREYLADVVRKRTKCLGTVSEMTFAEARKAAQRFLGPINDVTVASESADKTMSHLIAHWMAVERSNLKLSTQNSYGWAIKRIEPAFSGVALPDITKPDVQSFLVSASHELAPVSVQNLRAHLSGLLTVAEELGWIVGNPAKGRIRLPPAVRARIPVRQKSVMNPEQWRLLVNTLHAPYSTMVVLAVLTGLRVGELAALRWNDISGDRLVVDEAIYRGVLGTPKGHLPKRTSRIGRRAVIAIEEWRSASSRTGQDDFLFGLNLHNAIRRVIKPACRLLRIPVVSWHDLRHTYTTWGRQAGISPEVMRDQLGHASIKTTLGIYSHMAELDDTAAAAVEGFAYGGVQ